MAPTQQMATTPWRTPSDLLTLRSALYHPSTPSSRNDAIALIRAYKLRGNLPHAIESTGLLFSALDFHSAQLASAGPADTFPVRAAYTLALSRFVTGFADLGRHRAGPGMTMQDVARSINLPPHFVELRHEAAHEEVPTLGRLQGLTDEAVRWLWDSYWVHLDDGVEAERVGNVEGRAEGDVQAGATEVFKGFRSRMLVLLKKGKDVQAQAAEVTSTCQACVYLSGGYERTWADVSKVLIQMIIPSRLDPKEVSKLMQGAKLLWDDLLRALASDIPEFLPAFLETGIELIASLGPEDQRTQDGMLYWFERMLTASPWVRICNSHSIDVYGQVMQLCCLHASDNSQEVAENVMTIKGRDIEFVTKWQPFMSTTESADKDIDMEIAAAADEIRVEDLSDNVNDGPDGWRIDRTSWRSVPLGVVPAQ